jgi:Arc/MetJ family transcription regulator
MKMTMHIDEELLQRAMESHGYVSKPEAVDMALCGNRIVRRGCGS